MGRAGLDRGCALLPRALPDCLQPLPHPSPFIVGASSHSRPPNHPPVNPCSPCPPCQANAHFGDLFIFESTLCFDLKMFAFHKQMVRPE